MQAEALKKIKEQEHALPYLATSGLKLVAKTLGSWV